MPSVALWAYSAEKLFIISCLSRPAGRSKHIFTEGVVKENVLALSVIAARCQIPPFVAARHLPPAGGSRPSKWEPLAVHAKFISLPRPLPLGEVDLRSKDGEGEPAKISPITILCSALTPHAVRAAEICRVRGREGAPASARSPPVSRGLFCWGFLFYPYSIPAFLHKGSPGGSCFMHKKEAEP